jgi:integrase
MAATMVKTKTPGVYKRGGRYVIAYRLASGKQKYDTFRTYDEARREKKKRDTDVDRGTFDEQSRVTLHAYALEWVESYQGNGEHEIRKGTRNEYRRQLKQYVLAYFPSQTKLSELRPTTIKGFTAWLRKQTKPAPTKEDPERRVLLADATLKRIMAPLQACLSTAVQEGLIPSNPTRDVKIAKRQSEDGDGEEETEDEEVKAMNAAELATMLQLLPERWRLFFWFLASTGLRISEAIALSWRHLDLDGSTPHVKVRRGLVKGVMGKPKSKYGKREIPLDHALVLALRAHRKDSEWPGAKDPVFAAGNGSRLIPENLYKRVLVPAREEACLKWVGFHAFRHTCASMLFAEGRNVKQVQRWLGHHSPSFTLDTYIHLLDEGIGGPLKVPQGANKVQTRPTPTHHKEGSARKTKSQHQSQIPDPTTLQTTAGSDF